MPTGFFVLMGPIPSLRVSDSCVGKNDTSLLQAYKCVTKPHPDGCDNASSWMNEPMPTSPTNVSARRGLKGKRLPHIYQSSWESK